MRIVVHNYLKSGSSFTRFKGKGAAADAIKPKKRTTDCGAACECADCQHDRMPLRSIRDAKIGDWYFMEVAGTSDQLDAMEQLVRRLGGAEIGSSSQGVKRTARYRVLADKTNALRRGADQAGVTILHQGPY